MPGVSIFANHAFRPLAALSHAIEASKATVLVPGDDRCVALMHRLHAVGSPAERHLIETSLGDPAFYHITRTRLGVLECARRAGLKVPRGARIDTPADLRGWLSTHAAPFVLKVDGAWSGLGVRVARNEAAAERAFHDLSGGLRLPVAVKRLLVNRDAYWVADRLRQKHPPVVSAQEYITGRPGNLAMVCRDGEMLAASVVETVACWGETGPSTIVRRVSRPDFIEGARTLAASLGLSGFFGLDFMVDDATDEALLIEMNPRATALCNIRIAPDGDLIAAAIQAWGGQPIPAAAPIEQEMIAHFPLSWHWNRVDLRLADCHQDIPAETPALVEAMLAPSWPDRQTLARLLAAARRRFAGSAESDVVRLAGVSPAPMVDVP